MEKLLVSIIVPVYNASDYLSRCINSLMKQTYNKIEIIIIDDGSSDSSLNECRSFKRMDDRIMIIHKENGGVSSARNIGLDRASGEYILFVDADDYLEPNCVEKCVQVAINQKVDIVKFSYCKMIGKIRKEYSYHCITNSVIDHKDYKKLVFPFVLSTYDFSNIWTMFIRKKLAKSIKFEDYCVGEDFLYSTYCIMSSANMFLINKPLYCYVINNNSKTQFFSVDNVIIKLNDELCCIEKVFDSMSNDVSRKSFVERVNMSLSSNLVLWVQNLSIKEFSTLVKKIVLPISEEEINDYNKQLMKRDRFLFLKIRIIGVMKKCAKIVLRVMR